MFSLSYTLSSLPSSDTLSRTEGTYMGSYLHVCIVALQAIWCKWLKLDVHLG